MCELFAMSSKLSTNVTLSLKVLALHGGKIGPHADGWGIAYYEEFDARVLREPASAASSTLMKYVCHEGVQSHLVISHIRKATQGALKLSNTHPFQRELGGRIHTLAHNGDLQHIEKNDKFSLKTYHPVGTTDSEYAFCVLMQRLRNVWEQNDLQPPPLSVRMEVISHFFHEMSQLGPANFLYTDGEYLYAYGDKRTQADGERKPPGLHVLTRTCTSPVHDHVFVGVTVEKIEEQVVTLFASVPLSDEGWRPLEQGELVVVRLGEVAV